MKSPSLAGLTVWWSQMKEAVGTLFIGILALAFFVGGILLIKKSIESIRFDKKCQATVGVLGNTYTKVTRKIFFVEYRVTYQIVVGGSVYPGRDELAEKPLQEYIEVFYLPEDPSNNRLKRGKYKFEFFCGVFAFVMSWLFFKGYQRSIGVGKQTQKQPKL